MPRSFELHTRLTQRVEIRVVQRNTRNAMSAIASRTTHARVARGKVRGNVPPRKRKRITSRKGRRIGARHASPYVSSDEQTHPNTFRDVELEYEEPLLVEHCSMFKPIAASGCGTCERPPIMIDRELTTTHTISVHRVATRTTERMYLTRR